MTASRLITRPFTIPSSTSRNKHSLCRGTLQQLLIFRRLSVWDLPTGDRFRSQGMSLKRPRCICRAPFNTPSCRGPFSTPSESPIRSSFLLPKFAEHPSSNPYPDQQLPFYRSKPIRDFQISPKQGSSLKRNLLFAGGLLNVRPRPRLPVRLLSVWRLPVRTSACAPRASAASARELWTCLGRLFR
jgi:hypothetical protein